MAKNIDKNKSQNLSIYFLRFRKKIVSKIMLRQNYLTPVERKSLFLVKVLVPYIMSPYITLYKVSHIKIRICMPIRILLLE